MKKIFLISVLAFIISVSFFKNFFAEPAKEVLKMYVGQVEFMPVSHPSRIVIGNPEILDVTNASVDQITFRPKAPGTTTLVIRDNFGEEFYQVKVFTQNMDDVKDRIDNLMVKLGPSDTSTQAANEEGVVFLLGQFNTSADKDRATLAMGPLKEKIVDLTTIKEDEAVVEIDVQVLELNRGSSEALGFTWPGSATITQVASSFISPAGAGTASLAKLFELGRLTHDAFTLKLDFLIKEGKARILSRPRLSCLSGKEAKLLVGGEVPILSSTVTGGGTAGTTATPGSVSYKEYGIKLNIKPTVKENGRIYLNLGVEVSEIGEKVETNYALAYPLTKRSANTELYIDDGQTMAIGGLIKQKTEEDLRKFPWLADVPVLGMFFRRRETKTGTNDSVRGDSELFITLTPRIVSTKKAAVGGITKTKIDDKPETVRPVIDEALLDPTLKYSQVVQMRILDNITYPVAGKGAGFQGTVKLGLKLSYKGELLGAKVISSSGYKILDDNTLKTARSISSYPPFPPAIDSDVLWIEVPIAYKLD